MFLDSNTGESFFRQNQNDHELQNILQRHLEARN